MALKLQAEIGLDGSGFESGLRRIEHAAGHVAGELKGLALQAFGIYGVEQAIHKTVDRAEELVTASKRLGVGVEQLQVMRQAAKESGVELNNLETAFEKINVARAKALGGGDGSSAALAAFKNLGVTKEALRTITAGGLFLGPIRDTANRRSQEDLAGPMKEIFKKGFGELIPLLKSDFQELEEKMKHLGSVMTTETAVQVKYLADEFGLISNIIVAQLAPALISFVEFVYKIAGAANALIAGFGALTSRITMKNIGSFIVGLANPFASSPVSRLNLDWLGALNAFGESRNKSDDSLEGIKAKLKSDADNLNHPKVPDFDTEEVTPKTKRPGRIKDVSDSLTRVGNFLGGSQSPMERIAHVHTTLLRQIAHNTSHSPAKVHHGEEHGGLGLR